MSKYLGIAMVVLGLGLITSCSDDSGDCANGSCFDITGEWNVRFHLYYTDGTTGGGVSTWYFRQNTTNITGGDAFCNFTDVSVSDEGHVSFITHCRSRDDEVITGDFVGPNHMESGRHNSDTCEGCEASWEADRR
ncbi:MAG: hypothetical protein WC604_01255 [Candidatus Gracilibacteria bacterium]